MAQIRERMQELTGCQFNSCLLNLYRDGATAPIPISRAATHRQGYQLHHTIPGPACAAAEVRCEWQRVGLSGSSFASICSAAQERTTWDGTRTTSASTAPSLCDPPFNSDLSTFACTAQRNRLRAHSAGTLR